MPALPHFSTMNEQWFRYVETIVHSGFGFRVETPIHIDLFIEVKRIFLLALTSLLLFSQIHLLCHKNDTAHILHMQMDG